MGCFLVPVKDIVYFGEKSVQYIASNKIILTLCKIGNILPLLNKCNDRVDDCELRAGETGSCLSDEVLWYAVQLSHPAVTLGR